MDVKKRISTILVFFTVLLMTSSTVSATPSDVYTSPELGIDEIYQAVQDLREAGASDEDIINFKSQHGLRTISKESVSVDQFGNEIDPNDISLFNLNPIYHTTHNWIDYMEQGTFAGKYIIYAEQERAELYGLPWGEKYPASYDVVGISWDPTVFQYVDSRVLDSNSNWLQDADNRLSGTVLFSLKDNYPGFFTSCYVIVNKLESNVNTSTAVKYTHTYDSTEKSESYSGNASWTWGQPAQIGVNYQVNTTTVEENWSKAATAYIEL